METSFITPIQLWGSLEGLNGGTSSTDRTLSAYVIFLNIFERAVHAVRDTERHLLPQQYLLSTGQLDSPHTVQIAASEAQLSTNMLVQLRNKALDAYNELMRISL